MCLLEIVTGRHHQLQSDGGSGRRLVIDAIVVRVPGGNSTDETPLAHVPPPHDTQQEIFFITDI